MRVLLLVFCSARSSLSGIHSIGFLRGCHEIISPMFAPDLNSHFNGRKITEGARKMYVSVSLALARGAITAF